MAKTAEVGKVKTKTVLATERDGTDGAVNSGVGSAISACVLS